MKNDKKYNKDYNKIFADRFREVRKAANLTQPQIAELLHVLPQTISNYATGRRRITEQTAHLMSEICGIDENYLLDETVTHKTKGEKIATIFKKTCNENSLQHQAIVSLLELNGYEYNIQKRNGRISIEELFEISENYCIISKDGKELCSLSIKEFDRLGNILNDMFNVLLNRYYFK